MILSKSRTSVLSVLLDSLLMIWTLLQPPENATLILISLMLEMLINSPYLKLNSTHRTVQYYVMGWSIYFAMVILFWHFNCFAIFQ